MQSYFVYILLCADNSYYTGITNNVDRRFEEHSLGIDNKCYTFNRRPIKLVYHTEFPDTKQAIEFEKQIKDWSRKKKEALIRGDWEDLHNFSECTNPSNSKNRSIK